MAIDYAGKHLPGGFGRARAISPPEQAAKDAEQKSNQLEKKEIGKIQSHAKEVTIRKEPKPEGGHKYTVRSHEGRETEHPDHKSAMAQAAHELGEVSEPESAQDEVPQENALGIAPSGDEGASGQ